MKLWIEIDENNRLTGYSSTSVERFFEVEIEEEPTNLGEWKYSGGQLVYDPDGYVPPEIVPEPNELDLLKIQNAKLLMSQAEQEKNQQELAQQVAKITMELEKQKESAK